MEELTREQMSVMPKKGIQEFLNRLTGKTKEETPTEPEEQKEASEAIKPEDSEGGKVAEPVPAEKSIDDLTVEELKEALKLERENNGKAKKIIGKQGNEIGDIRKQITEKETLINELKSKTERTPEELRDLFDENPKEAMKVLQEDETRSQKIDIESLNKKALETQLSINERIPEFPNMIEDMAVLLANDGTDPQVINDFKKSPYYVDSATLFFLAKRVESERELAALKVENEKLKNVTNNVAKNIANAGKSASLLQNKAGSAYNVGATNVLDGLDSRSIATMSRARLKEIKLDSIS